MRWCCEHIAANLVTVAWEYTEYEVLSTLACDIRYVNNGDRVWRAKLVDWSVDGETVNGSSSAPSCGGIRRDLVLDATPGCE